MSFHTILNNQLNNITELVYKTFDVLTQGKIVDIEKYLLNLDYPKYSSYEEMNNSDDDIRDLQGIIEYRNSFTGNIIECIPMKVEGGVLYVYCFDNAAQEVVSINLDDINSTYDQITLIWVIENAVMQ